MTLQLSTQVRNARLDAVESAIGASPILEIRSGIPPADCAVSDAGTLLASVTLPSDWMAAASGSKEESGTWEDASADANGLAGHYRIKNSAGTTCHVQGLASQPWAASAPFALNQQVNNNGLVYKCVTAGVSAASAGPAGQSAGIADGSCVWDYMGAADMVLVNTNNAATQQITITSFTISELNA